MPQFIQGFGYVKTLSATGPEEMNDGTPLARDEVSHFEMFMEYQGGLKIDGMIVYLSDDPNTPEWDGKFSEPIYIDDHEPGVYIIRFKTVDIYGRKSVESENYVMWIHPEPKWLKRLKAWLDKYWKNRY